MKGYFTKVAVQGRFDNDTQAENFVSELKNNSMFEVVKSTLTKRENKKMEEEWVRVDVVLAFNDEKEPDSLIDIEFSKNNNFFTPTEGYVSEYEEDEE